MAPGRKNRKGGKGRKHHSHGHILLITTFLEDFISLWAHIIRKQNKFNMI